MLPVNVFLHDKSRHPDAGRIGRVPGPPGSEVERTRKKRKMPKIEPLLMEGPISTHVSGYAISCQKAAPHHFDPLYAIAAQEEFARRIIACVNACAGLETASLEAAEMNLFGYSDEMTSQRDELLGLLKRLVRYAPGKYVDDPRSDEQIDADKVADFQLAIDTIARVEGE